MKKNHPDIRMVQKKRIIQRWCSCCVLLFLLIGTANAQSGDNINTKTVALGFTQEKLHNALLALEKSAGFRLVFPSEPVDAAHLVDLPKEERTVAATLQLILKGTNLDFKQTGNTIVLFLKNEKPQTADALKTPPVRGIVLDETGEPLPGAAVVVKNDVKKNTTTDISGNFELAGVEPNATLIITFLGYEVMEYALNGRNNVTIRLISGIVKLDEVVVTGYQTVSRERATGAYAIVGENSLDKKISINAIAALEGQVAGVTTYGGNIVIRGRSTLSAQVGTNPLVVLDGLPTERNINDINMNDVESFTILKDAAATSIYGSRAANGVIVITTKKGEQGRTLVNFTADWQWTENPSLSDYNYASTSTYIDYEQGFLAKRATESNMTIDDYLKNRMVGIGEGNIRYFSPLYSLRYKLATDPDMTSTDYDAAIQAMRGNDFRQEYMDEMWRTPFRQSYNLSISSASERQNTYASFNYIGDLMQMRTNNRHTFKGYIKSTQKVTKWLSVDVGMDAQYGKTETTYNTLYFNTQSSIIEPYNRIKNANGDKHYMDYTQPFPTFTGQYPLNPRVVEQLSGKKDFSPYSYNILDEVGLNTESQNVQNLRALASINVDIYTGLKFKSSFDYETSSISSEQFNDSKSYLMRVLRNRFISETSNGSGVFVKNIPDGGYLLQTGNSANNYTFRNQFDYNTTIADKHEITMLAGFEMRETKSPLNTKSQYYGYDPQTLTVATLNNAIFNYPGYRSYIYSANQQLTNLGNDDLRYSLHRYISFYAAGGYSYKNLYNVTGSIRIDQADLFGTNPKYRYRPLWSVGASWNISNENFMKDVSWIDMLSIKGSYGVTGNVDQSSSPYVLISLGTSSFFTQPIPYTKLNNIAPNPLLRWEKTTSYALGVDFALWSGLLTGKMEGYYKYSDDLLVTSNLPKSSGYPYATVNNGSLSNKGLEITLNSPWLRTGDWTLTSTFLIGWNKNDIKSVRRPAKSASDFIVFNKQYYEEGRAYNSLYAYRYAGISSGGNDYQNGAPVVTMADGTPYYTIDDAGNLSYIDSYKVKPSEAVYMGVFDPIWTGSFTQNVKYKNWELTAMFSFAGGHKIRKPAYNFAIGKEPTPGNLSGDVEHAWTPQNPNSTIPKSSLYYSRQAENYLLYIVDYWRYSDVHVASGNMIRLRNLALSYRLPAKYSKVAGMQNVKFTAQANNLWLWSAAGNGIDPEMRQGNTSDWTLPVQPSYLLRLEITF